MVLNAAVQMLREAEELKQKISKFKSGTSMLQERSLWVTQQQLQKIYQKVLVLDLEYALDKKVEQDLWNIGFKQQIEALQSISKDRKNPLRSEGQAMLSWVLQAAAGFYLCLLHQICTTFKLDLPFRRRASLLGWVEGWGAGEAATRPPPPPAARYICQHCLVHLGDLARYRQQLRVAHTFYRHALVVSAHSGQPYNQLALVAWRCGRRLGAVYWHVRSLLVRAPFPPAAHNLERTLRAAASQGGKDSVPGVPGGLGGPRSAAPPPAPDARHSPHSYITDLLRAVHLIHTLEELESAEKLVKALNSSLSTLIATDSFESMTLIKMTCVLIWLVHSTSPQLNEELSAMTDAESAAARLGAELAGGALLALLLPAYTADQPPARTLPALKVWLQWAACHPAAVYGVCAARAALWPALVHVLNALRPPPRHSPDLYERSPLSEDEELVGFSPLAEALRDLRLPDHAAWDTYGGRIPPVPALSGEAGEAGEAAAAGPPDEAEAGRLRAHRIVRLGQQLAQLCPEHLSYTESEGAVTFAAAAAGGEQLSAALAELSAARAAPAPAADADEDSDDEPPAPPPPIVISEADFREKVREKRVGILKPQGSLERAREERALAGGVEEVPEPESSPESARGEERREARKPRVNIAMAAIMRKQEETNKQVKFVTPPPTPEPSALQPRPGKSLALPLGRKTGGILALKDKSGYPHLVNAEPEPAPAPDAAPAAAWPPPEPAPEPPRTPTRAPNTNIRLPVVNPKEIDVRSAALQRQSARQLGADGHRFGYQMSGDKRSFLEDLPPRFANQYRHWHAPEERREEPGAPRWPPADCPQVSWWKGEAAGYSPPAPSQSGYSPPAPPQPGYSPPAPPQPGYFSPQPGAFRGAYGRPPGDERPTYAPPQPLATNFGTLGPALGGFGFAPSVGYDANMFPQFGEMLRPLPPPASFPGKELLERGYGRDQPRGLHFGDSTSIDLSFDQNKVAEGSGGEGSTYSLFSGAPAPAAAWGAPPHPHQSLWSGPGPSPLERLLEQQKQMKLPQ